MSFSAPATAVVGAAASGAFALAALKACGFSIKISADAAAQQPPADSASRKVSFSKKSASSDSHYLEKVSESGDESSSGSDEVTSGKGYQCKHAVSECHIEERHMDSAVSEAREGLHKGEGGPFGACIVRNGEVVARAHNMVLQTNDPTAHAEVTCIRKASARLGRFDLSDCVLYTTCEPCPMCYGAVHWAKIPVCVYAADRNDAAAAGFDDAFIYDAIKGTAVEEHVKMVHQPNCEAVEVFGETFQSY